MRCARLTGKKTYLVGHSLGGPLALRAIMDMPELYAGAVIAAGSIDPDLEKIHFLQPIAKIRPFRWLLPKHLHNSNLELLGHEAELAKIVPHLDAMQTPIVIIHGTEDKLVPYENAEYLAQNYGGKYEMMTLHGNNHFLPWNAKADMDKAIALMLETANYPLELW